MLVLSRKEGQLIKLGDEIVVTVVRIGKEKVRLGIKAPSNIRVLRGEVDPNDEDSDVSEVTLTVEAESELRGPHCLPKKDPGKGIPRKNSQAS